MRSFGRASMLSRLMLSIGFFFAGLELRRPPNPAICDGFFGLLNLDWGSMHTREPRCQKSIPLCGRVVLPLFRGSLLRLLDLVFICANTVALLVKNSVRCTRDDGRPILLVRARCRCSHGETARHSHRHPDRRSNVAKAGLAWRRAKARGRGAVEADGMIAAEGKRARGGWHWLRGLVFQRRLRKERAMAGQVWILDSVLGLSAGQYGIKGRIVNV